MAPTGVIDWNSDHWSSNLSRHVGAILCLTGPRIYSIHQERSIESGAKMVPIDLKKNTREQRLTHNVEQLPYSAKVIIRTRDKEGILPKKNAIGDNEMLALYAPAVLPRFTTCSSNTKIVSQDL